MNAIKKIFTALGVLFAFGLFAGLSGVSAIFAVRYFGTNEPQRSAIQTPSIVHPAPQPVITATPVNDPNPAPAENTPKDEQPNKPLQGVYGWSLTRVLEQSHTGRELTRYAGDYVKVMNQSIAELDKALKSNDSRLNRAEAQKMRADFVTRRDGMDNHTASFLTRIVTEACASDESLAGVSLIEEKNFTRLSANADLTAKVIETIDRLHMKLPPLPKPLKLPEPPKQNAKPAPKQEAPKSQRKGK